MPTTTVQEAPVWKIPTTLTQLFHRANHWCREKNIHWGGRLLEDDSKPEGPEDSHKNQRVISGSAEGVWFDDPSCGACMSGFLQTVCCSTSMQVQEAAHISYLVAAYRSWKAHEQKAHEQCRNNTRAAGVSPKQAARLSNQLPHWCPRSKPARRLQLQEPSCPHFTKKIGSRVASYFLGLGCKNDAKSTQ